jgi:hypothetical protein
MHQTIISRDKIGSLRHLTRQDDKHKHSRQLVYEQSESNNHWLSLSFGADTPNQRFYYFTASVDSGDSAARSGNDGQQFTKPHDGDGLCASFTKLVSNIYCI